MVITDIFIFTNIFMFTTYSDASYIFQHTISVFGMFPVIWLAGFIFHKRKIKTFLNMAREKLPCCSNLLNCGSQNKANHHVQQIGDFNDLPGLDRMLHPAQYV